MIWIATAAFVLTMVIKLAFDYRLRLKGKPNNHLYGPIAVLIILVGCSYLCGWQTTTLWFFGWWALYDPAMSLLMGQEWDYIGNTAWLDRMQHKYKGLQVFKYVGAIGSLLFIIIRSI